jgi:hypothetical protein
MPLIELTRRRASAHDLFVPFVSFVVQVFPSPASKRDSARQSPNTKMAASRRTRPLFRSALNAY